MKNYRDYDVVKTWKMPNHEYAQCKILERRDGALVLQSYNTIVVSITKDGWMDCSGIYSRTTIKHIGWFMKCYGNGCGYYDAKWAWQHDSCVNIYTGEVLTYEEYNKKFEEIA